MIPSQASAAEIFAITDQIVPQFESFSAHPYWDEKRYSWGYGTPAPGATGTITREQALVEMRAHRRADYDYLRPLITRMLNAKQWAAYLSFAYNEGDGNADNLVDDINAGDDAVLEVHWKKYIYAGGVVKSYLIDRRNKEWQLWIS